MISGAQTFGFIAIAVGLKILCSLHQFRAKRFRRRLFEVVLIGSGLTVAQAIFVPSEASTVDFGGWYLCAVLVIFRSEMKMCCQGIWNVFIWRAGSENTSIEVIREVAGAATRMSRERIGGLIVFERIDSLSQYRNLGEALDGAPTSILVESHFFPGSPMHDGAVIIRGNKFVAGSVMFPLSFNPSIINDARRLGTRHRSGVGVTEVPDAVSIIISEETGRISIASRGELNYGVESGKVEEIIQETLNLRPSLHHSRDHSVGL